METLLVSPPQSELQSGRHAHSLKSRAVQRQGCERGVREVAAARQAEGLQPGAAPADLHHAFVRNALGTQNRKAGQKAQETETWDLLMVHWSRLPVTSTAA